jgi:hypothetical protein
MSAPDPADLAEHLRNTADAAALRPVAVDAVLAASRARRRARRTAIVGGASAAVAVLAVGGLVLGLQPFTGGSITADAPASQETLESTDLLPQEAAGEASDTRLAPPEKVNACGLELAAPTEASPSGLVVTVEPVGPVASGAEGDVRVLVTNAGGSTVTGEVRPVPAMAVAAGGVTAWHTNGVVTADLQPIELAPGESTELRGAVRAVACTEADEAAESFPGDLPPLAPGAYGVSAVVMFVDRASGGIEYLIAPSAPLTVR